MSLQAAPARGCGRARHERGRRRTLADVWSGRQNGFGLIRLLLSTAVIVAHARVLGFGGHGPFYYTWQKQTEIGGFAVLGFFAVSGMLITRSANRITTRQFAWHRFLRIMPGLWLCLVVTAFVVGPAVALHDGMPMRTYFSHSEGPWQYLQANWSLAVRQHGLSGLLAHNRLAGTFNGALWSLPLELLCYMVVAALAALGILQRSRLLLLLMLLAAWLYLANMALRAGTLRMDLYSPTGVAWNLPYLGYISMDQLLPLMFTFGLGAAVEVYRDRLPMNKTLGVVSALVLALALTAGGLTTYGLPAFVYFMVWAGIYTPRPLTRIGSRADFSYGLYVYGFVAEQTLIAFGTTRWGLPLFTLASLGLALAAAMFSWHLVEKPAMRLKNLRHLPFRRGSKPGNHTPPQHRHGHIGSPADEALPSTSAGAS
ncbi:acyltransferase family protein [Kitasatospora sp. NPDC101801]|uniref:acyltransferase family protein n=1 Tax=Kitasatospora sp. NPDC101801 TaxID=3364103 RepID=UPI00380BB514